MRIPFDEKASGCTPLYVGGERSRLATMSGVALISDKQLVTNHLWNSKLYLVDFDLATNTHSIRDRITTTWRGQPCFTDLVAFDGVDNLVSSNCEKNSFSTYRVGDNLHHERDYPLPSGFCHGVKFFAPTVVCACCTTEGRHVCFVDLSTGKTLYRFSGDAWQPKDVCFFDDYIVLIYQNGRADIKRVPGYESKVELIHLDLVGQKHHVLHEVLIKNCNADQVTYTNGKLYISNQTSNKVHVLAIQNEKLVFEQELCGFNGRGFDFPHGVSVRDGVIAVTNYGDSSVYVDYLDRVLLP